VLYTIVLGVPVVLGGLLDRTGRFAFACVRVWSRLILSTCGIDVTVVLAPAMPTSPAIYAANHGSALDIPIMFGYLPVGFRVIHKRSLYVIPIIGWYLLLGGHIGIDRSKPFRARKALEAAGRRIRSGISLLVFPEGTRSSDAEVKRFKRGSFVLALSSGAPVVPVSLVGVKRVAPAGYLTWRPGSVRLVLHPPVVTAGRNEEQAAALAAEVRDVVARGCVEA
jgi:1-acyl-sn-glycerol-3-phosphate acyltransferase